MKIFSALFPIMFLARAFAYTADDGAKTILTSGTASDTTNAVAYVDAKNEDGWVMTIGSAGGSYTWSIDVNFNIGQTWTVKGASDSDRPTISVSSSVNVVGLAASGKIITLKDIKWTNSGALDGLLSLEGSSGNVGPNFRVTNCSFANSGNGRSLFIEEYGLVDHCQFTGSDENRIWCRNSDVGWTGSHTFGTTNTIVIEDCWFHNSSAGPVVMSQVLDGDQAMRVIFRFNVITNGNCESHGFTSGEGNEALQAEIYKNNFYLSGDGGDQADWAVYVWRGGTGVAFSNTVTQVGTFAGYNSMFKFRAEQSDPYLADHQPGTGLVSPSTVGRVAIYHWDNSGFDGVTFTTDEGTMIVNTDYFTNTAKPGYTTLTYPHPLAGWGAIVASTAQTSGRAPQAGGGIFNR